MAFRSFPLILAKILLMGIHSEDPSNPAHTLEGDFHTPLTVLVFLALLILFTMFLSSGIYFVLEGIYGISVQDAMKELSINNSPRLRNYIRLALGINHSLIFIAPPFIAAIFLYKKDWTDYLKLNIKPIQKTIRNSLLGILLIFSAFPFAQFTFWLNKKIPLPDWAKSIEDSTNSLLRNMLGTESELELFLNILVIAVIPAIGEELVFRGIIQRNLEKWTTNPHLAVWMAAFIFSAFHMQFEGFIPRFLLGAMLGYLFYWSTSLWVPIIAHFAHNAIQVIALFLYSNQLSRIDIEQIEEVPASITIVSIILVLGISYYIIQFNRHFKDSDS